MKTHDQIIEIIQNKYRELEIERDEVAREYQITEDADLFDEMMQLSAAIEAIDEILGRIQ